jgi:hypothetical protein
MRKETKDVLRTYQWQENVDNPYREKHKDITENRFRGKDIGWLAKDALRKYAKQGKKVYRDGVDRLCKRNSENVRR